jgi:hypothetical protein
VCFLINIVYGGGRSKLKVSFMQIRALTVLVIFGAAREDGVSCFRVYVFIESGAQHKTISEHEQRIKWLISSVCLAKINDLAIEWATAGFWKEQMIFGL